MSALVVLGALIIGAIGSIMVAVPEPITSVVGVVILALLLLALLFWGR